MLTLFALCLVGLNHVSATSAGISSNTSKINGITSSACALYTVQSGDTCLSIAWSNNISFAQLISWNSEINSACSNLASLDGTTICASNPNGSNYTLAAAPTTAVVTGPVTAAPIPSPTLSGSNSYCGQWYQVELGQDCGTIEEDYGISLGDFVFLNPEVWENCTNLEANVYYCVEAVGSISTYMGYGTTTTPTATFIPTSMTSIPWTDLLSKYSTTNPIIPLAEGTRTDCYSYLIISSVNYENNTAIDCWASAMTWDVSPVDFVLWNPSLAQDSINGTSALVTATASSDYTYSCTLSSSLSYCAALSSPTPVAATNSTPPSPRAIGEVANCTTWGYIYDYTTCTSFLSSYDLTIAELYEMNPSVGTECSGLDIGTYYCISWYPDGINPQGWGFEYTETAIPTGTGTVSSTGVTTPSPVQTGILSDCDQFYKVELGDSCYNIAANYSITLDQLYAWNPALDNCANLDYGFYVCVGVQYSSSSPATASITTTGIITPTPYQSGMVAGCDTFYDVESGDGCYQIASSYSISLTDFYNWNPAVSSCSDLYPSYYVCVGTGVAAAAKRTVVPVPALTTAG